MVFDCNSGDFWIVSAAARRVVELLVAGAPRARHDIIGHICNDPILSIDEEGAAEIIDGLLSQKMIAFTTA